MFPASAARNYARGLISAAAGKQEAGALAAGLADFGRMLVESRELASALGNAALPLAKRIEVLRAVLKAAGAAPVLEGFLALLLENGHLRGLPAITAAVARAASEASGVTVASVRTAQPASAEELQKIGAALGQAVGRRVEVEASVDPALIGGFVARAGDLVFDASLSHQIEKMRAELRRP